MEQEAHLTVTSPAGAGAARLDAFSAFVIAGGEVAEGLPALVARAAWLAMLHEGDRLIGTAGLKVPNPGYHARTFADKAKSPLPHTDFPHELGWVLVASDRWGRGHASTLIDALLAEAGDIGLYATTRANNVAMHQALAKRGFVRSGDPYPSRRPNEFISLLVRAADAAARPDVNILRPA